jgi:hypothetical protein
MKPRNTMKESAETGGQARPPTGGFAIFDRFRTSSGRVIDRTVSSNDTKAALSRLSIHSGAGDLLTRIADMADRARPSGSQPIAILLVGVGGIPSWWKGDFDPDKHPRWPAKSPERQGGRFRTRGSVPDSGPNIVPTDPQSPQALAEAEARLKELARRAERRAVRRLIRELAVTALRGMVEAVANLVPILDVAADAALIADIVRAGVEIHELQAERQAVLDFIKNGPYTLDQLRVSQNDESFGSYDAFLKDSAEAAILEKHFGPAGDGYQYHHLVIQGGGNPERIPAEQLQSTENIIRIPTLLHEAINAAYSKPKEGTNMTLYEWVQTQPYDVQRAEAIKVLRGLGIIY